MQYCQPRAPDHVGAARAVEPRLKRFDGPLSLNTETLVGPGSTLLGYEIAVLSGEPGFGEARLPAGASVRFDVGPQDELVNSKLELAAEDAVIIAWKEARQA